MSAQPQKDGAEVGTMSNQRWITAAVCVAGAALLILLMLPMPAGSAPRILAAGLVILMIALMLLYTRVNRRAVEALKAGNNAFEPDCAHLQQQTALPGPCRLQGSELLANPPCLTDANLQAAAVTCDAAAAHRAKAQVVATMSHEVRTPLNAVLGMTDLLRLSALTRKQKTYVQIMESSSNMLLSLVDNMIDFATIESGKLELTRDLFRVTDLLERTLEIMGYPAYAKGIELAGTTNFDPEARLVGDFNRLQQIVINLVNNAIKYTDQGEVLINVGLESGKTGNPVLAVSVSDTGIGMPQQASGPLQLPLPPFADQLRSQSQGSGLGLEISKRLIDLMGGDIHVESEPGRGTTVSFQVPVLSHAEAERAGTVDRSGLSDRRILLANVNASIATSISSFLNDWELNCETTAVLDAVHEHIASAESENDPYHCVILDLGDTAIDRLAIARRLREKTRLPMVLLTSIAQPLEAGQISTIGRVRCIDKPVLPSVLRYNLLRLFELDTHDAGSSEETFHTHSILIAEDNPINRKLLSAMLASLEFDVDTVVDGPSVLEALEKRPFDLIFMDCQMPRMDGDEVTRIIREGHCVGDYQPVIVAVTADVTASHKQRCLAAGMDDFLPKPVRLETLKAGLRRWSLMVNDRRGQLQGPVQAGLNEDGDLISELQSRIRFNDNKALDEFIGLFIDDTEARLDLMQQALQRSDLKTIRRECHALKGACLEMGMKILCDDCDALGRASREQRLDDLPLELHRLVTDFERVKPVFEAKLRQPG